MLTLQDDRAATLQTYAEFTASIVKTTSVFCPEPRYCPVDPVTNLRLIVFVLYTGNETWGACGFAATEIDAMQWVAQSPFDRSYAKCLVGGILSVHPCNT